jgi:nicotinamidase-related amidase
VVLSTLRQAADLDYRLTVLADGCLDADPQVHQVLLQKVFRRQAEVTNIADWTASLRQAGPGTGKAAGHPFGQGVHVEGGGT